MFCEKCGSEINEETGFCANCNASADNANSANVNGGSANYRTKNDVANASQEATETPIYNPSEENAETPIYYPKEEPVYRSEIPMYDTTAETYRRRRKASTVEILSIVLGTIVALLIVLLIFMFAKSTNNGGGLIPDSGDTQKEEPVELELSVEEPPTVTDEFEYVFSGTASVEGCDAALSINGKFIETIEAGSENKKWSYKVQLDSDENDFEIELYDPDNKAETKETKSFEIRKLKYMEGTVLYKSCKEGLRIRTQPSTTAGKVLTLEYYESYIPMVCLGEEYYGEGYTWCKVRVKDRVGWVGTDGNVAPG